MALESITNLPSTHPILFLIACAVLLIGVPVTMHILNKKQLGSTGSFTDPVRVVTCYSAPVTFLDSAGIVVKLAPRAMEDLPLQVDLKIAYIDSSFSGRIGSVNGAKVKKDGPEGMVSIGGIPGGLCNKQFICRAWVSLAFFDRGGLWANANSSAEEIRQSNWLVKQQRKLSKKYGKGSFEKYQP